jgi:peptidoglycan hydrolase CwlO-like protein
MGGVAEVFDLHRLALHWRGTDADTRGVKTPPGTSPVRPSIHVGLALACALAASLVPSLPAGAGTLDDARTRLTELERQIALDQASIDATHERLEALGGEIADLQAAHDRTRVRLVETQRMLADLNERSRELQEELDAAAVTAYQWGPMAPFALALGADSLGDLAHGLQYFDSISRANAEAADALAMQARQVGAIRAGLSALSKQQSAIELDLRVSYEELTTEFLAQNELLARLAHARAEAAALVRRLGITADPNVTGAGVSFGRWAQLLLSRLGAPVCGDNLIAVVAWESAEGTAAAYNPLATTHDFPGATDFNTVGVKNYPSLGDGIQATIDTLTLGSPTYGYGPVLGSLAACAPAESTAAAINASAWCRGCAGGLYVLNVVPLVRADYERFAAR